MYKNKKIYIAGHNGMVGSACWNNLLAKNYTNIIGLGFDQLDLRSQASVDHFIKNEKPEVIINAAAKVGGINANNQNPYDFLMDNMLIQNNLIRSAHKNNVDNFIFLGSSCIYPKFSPQPIKEEYLLSDSLEPTNQWYAIAKISGVKLIEAINKQFNRNYVSLMPTNLYGPKDNYDLRNSHVIPALIRKFHEAKIKDKSEVVLWGSGSPMREFLHADDLAEAVVFFVENKFNDHIYNVGYGEDIKIIDLALIIKKIIGYNGKIMWDDSMPDGTPKKLLDSTKINRLGWKPKISLKTGLERVYKEFKENYEV